MLPLLLLLLHDTSVAERRFRRFSCVFHSSLSSLKLSLYVLLQFRFKFCFVDNGFDTRV